MRVVGFGLALLAATASAQKKGDVTYQCPKGWEQSGENCIRTTTVKAISRTETQFNEVAPLEHCPKGYEATKDACVREEVVPKITHAITEQVPQKVCPSGTQQTKEGCIVTRTVTKKVAEQNHKQVNAQRVSKKTEYVTVKKPVSVPAGEQCPKGSQQTKEGCIVVSQLAGYEVVEVEKTLKLPKDEKVVTEACPDGSKAPCVIQTPFQAVKEMTNQAKGTAPQLEEKQETVTLKSTVKVAREVCPQGATPVKGACVIKTMRQIVKAKSTPRTVPGAITTEQIPRKLKLARTEVVPSYSCPKGSMPSGKKGDVCIVKRTAAHPETKEFPKRVKVARAVKVPKQVKVPKTIAIATEACPKGSEPGKGACVMKTTIQVPYTVETPVQVCPSGFTEEKGGCVRETKVYVPAEEVPVPTKGKGKKEQHEVTLVCPTGTQKDSAGLCFKTHFETAPAETLTAVKIAFKTETVTETVPALVTYTTKTEYEEATIEEIHIEFQEETAMETNTELRSEEIEEQVPAIVNYATKTVYEEVEVTDVLACQPGSGNGGKGKGKDTRCGEMVELAETSFSVETEYQEEEVPMVQAWSLEERTEQQVVTKTFITRVPEAVTEVTHKVEDVCTKGKKEQENCFKEVAPSQFVSFNTVYENLLVSDKKVKTTTHTQEETVQGAPTYRTVYEPEQHETAKLMVETVPTTLTEVMIKSETETERQVFQEGTILRNIAASEAMCPPGTREEGKGCVKQVSVPKQLSCPKGSQERHGTCVEKETNTITECPPGSTEGHKGCETTETIPATAVYGAEMPPLPEKKEYPVPAKKNFRRDY